MQSVPIISVFLLLALCVVIFELGFIYDIPGTYLLLELLFFRSIWTGPAVQPM